MKYLRNKIVSIQDAAVRKHIYTMYTVFNSTFIDIFGNKLYFSMECETVCVTKHGYNTLPHPQKTGKKETHVFIHNTARSNFYTYLAIHSTI